MLDDTNIIDLSYATEDITILISDGNIYVGYYRFPNIKINKLKLSDNIIFKNINNLEVHFNSQDDVSNLSFQFEKRDVTNFYTKMDSVNKLRFNECKIDKFYTRTKIKELFIINSNVRDFKIFKFIKVSSFKCSQVNIINFYMLGLISVVDGFISTLKGSYIDCISYNNATIVNRCYFNVENYGELCNKTNETSFIGEGGQT